MRFIAIFLGAAGLLGIVLLTGIEAQEASSPGKPAPAESAKKFLGTWKGMMESPVSDPFPVTVQLEEFQYGKWCGVLEHAAPLDADGKLLGIKVEGNTMTLAQTVFRGRERCLDGLNVLTLIDDNTMERVWVDPDTGKPRDKGKLKRQTR